jgi:GNAT superfamily N-acetyltransferase
VSEALVRDATPADADALAPLLRELGYPSERDAVAERLAVLAGDEWSGAWVAEAGGAIVGAVSAHASPLLSRDTRICRITAMIVTAGAQGRGVGRALADRVEQQARRWNCDRIEVTSSDHRGGAHAFYARMGYEIKPHRFIKGVSVL